MKIKILSLLLFFSLSEINAQKRIEISKDWVDHNTSLEKKLSLKDLKQTKEDFYFRLSYPGVTVDIWKDSLNKPNGIISNYMFKQKNSQPKDTIVKKIVLQQIEADSVSDLIHKSKILDLPTDKEIEGWEQGFDGITYQIEYADKLNYSHKSYWTPTSQDSLKEAILVQNFTKGIEKILDLVNKYNQFQEDLPGGTYSNGGNWAMTKFSDPYVVLEINGNYRLPFGIGASYYQSRIKKKYVRTGVAFIFNHNLKDSYSLETYIYKIDLLFKDKSYSDKITFVYKTRKLDYIDESSSFQNYTIMYSIFHDKIADFHIGFDHLTNHNFNKNGVLLSIGKQIESVKTYGYAKIWYYNPAFFNYEIGLNKSIRTNLKLVPRIYTSLYYERLYNFEGLNFRVLVTINF